MVNSSNNDKPYYLFIQVIIVLIFLGLFSFLNYNENFIDEYIMQTRYSIISKILLLILTLLTMYIGREKFSLKNSIIYEIPISFSFLLLFLFVLISGSNLFVVYMAIEGISMIIYGLGGVFYSGFLNTESILKYFIINNIASGCLIWSFSYLYGYVGSLNVFELQYFLMDSLEILVQNYFHFVCIITVLSILIKLAICPFHWWIPDIYEGFWTPVTLSYAVIVKIGIFIFFFRLILNIFQPLGYINSFYLITAGLSSIFVGSLGALMQVKIKRFLGFSSIAHSGYIILGLASNTTNGAIAGFVYLFLYSFTTLAFFLFLLNTRHVISGKNLTFFNQLYALFAYNRELCFSLLIILCTMAAIPPFSSFFVKFYLYNIYVDNKRELIVWIVLILTIITLYYYLAFIQQFMFLKLEDLKLLFVFKSKDNLCFVLFVMLFIFTFGWILFPWLFLFFNEFVLSCIYPLIFN